MNQITVTEEKRMTVPQRKEAMPYEILADGDVIGVVREEEVFVPPLEPIKEPIGRTKCPNCKFEYDLPGKDNSPFFFSVRQPGCGVQ